jgi:hypothetical protein
VADNAAISSTVALLGALGAGSVLGQYVGSAKDRREARANVLAALAQTESTRWAGEDTASESEFLNAMRTLQTAAFVARLPRGMVWEYAALTQAARWLSVEEWDRTGDPEFGGGIDAYLADAVREAARAIAVVTWSSRLTHRWRWLSAKKRIGGLLTKLQSAETKRAVQRSKDTGFL